MTKKTADGAMREAMPFPFRWFDTLRELDDRELRAMLSAIGAYAANGETPAFTGALAALWNEIRQRIDSDRNRYADICDRNRKNGLTGGRPSVAPNSEKPSRFSTSEEKPEKPSGLFEGMKKPSGFSASEEKPKKPNADADADADGDADGEASQKVSGDTFTPKPEISGASGKRSAADKIRFDYEGDARLHGITPEQLAIWRENFPALDVDGELRKATVWLDANRKKRKHDVKRFLATWLTQAQDRTLPPRRGAPGDILTEERRNWSNSERG